MNFVVKLAHLADCAVLFKQYFVHIATFVVVIGHVPVTYHTLEYLSALVCLSFFRPVVDCYGFGYYKVVLLTGNYSLEFLRLSGVGQLFGKIIWHLLNQE